MKCIILLNNFFYFSTSNDEFADFSSAFTQNMSLKSNPTNLCKFYFLICYRINAIYFFISS